MASAKEWPQKMAARFLLIAELRAELGSAINSVNELFFEVYSAIDNKEAAFPA